MILVLYIQIETAFPDRDRDVSYMSFGKSFHNYTLRLRKLSSLCSKTTDNGQLGLYSILLVGTSSALGVSFSSFPSPFPFKRYL